MPLWTLHKRYSDLRGLLMTEAICEHGVGHHNGVHGCDGCCKDMPSEMREEITHD
jgi:hypothetical protein